MQNYIQYKELHKLASQYDWAVEGFPAPEGNELTVEKAVEIRTSLIKLASAIEL